MSLFSIILLLLSSIVLLLSSIGIYRCTNTLQTLHFCTIIDVICIPLALFSTLFSFGTDGTRVIIPILVFIILSPIASYFIGKFYNEKHSINEK